MELVCPAGNLPSLKAALNAGADSIYIAFRNDTNARTFPGPNFDRDSAQSGISYAHQAGRKVFVALNTYPRPEQLPRWLETAETALELGADALILADIGMMQLIHENFPDARLHLSVRASATSRQALKFYRKNFHIRRAALPRALSLSQVKNLASCTSTPLEVFGFGGLCTMAEGRCHLSSYLTGHSPNQSGVCSPASAVRWEQTSASLDSRLNGVLIDRFASHERAGYSTLCKGRFRVANATFHALEEPSSLSTMELLPELHKAGIAAIKLESPQRGLSHTRRITKVWRQALDCLAADPAGYSARTDWMRQLAELSEGQQTTSGACHRP